MAALGHLSWIHWAIYWTSQIFAMIMDSEKWRLVGPTANIASFKKMIQVLTNCSYKNEAVYKLQPSYTKAMNK